MTESIIVNVNIRELSYADSRISHWLDNYTEIYIVLEIDQGCFFIYTFWI